MSDEKLKVSELPEQEQNELIAEAVALGMKPLNLKSYKVSTLKAKIEELKNAPTDEQKDAEGEQNAPKDEQKDAEGEQNASKDEQNGENVNNETIEETKPEPPAAEEKKAPAKKPEPKVDGICHICRSKVINGVCTGCGFHK